MVRNTRYFTRSRRRRLQGEHDGVSRPPIKRQRRMDNLVESDHGTDSEFNLDPSVLDTFDQSDVEDQDEEGITAPPAAVEQEELIDLTVVLTPPPPPAQPMTVTDTTSHSNVGQRVPISFSVHQTGTDITGSNEGQDVPSTSTVHNGQSESVDVHDITALQQQYDVVHKKSMGDASKLGTIISVLTVMKDNQEKLVEHTSSVVDKYKTESVLLNKELNFVRKSAKQQREDAEFYRLNNVNLRKKIEKLQHQTEVIPLANLREMSQEELHSVVNKSQTNMIRANQVIQKSFKTVIEDKEEELKEAKGELAKERKKTEKANEEIKKKEQQLDNFRCGICKSRYAEVMLRQCGHSVACHQCWTGFLRSSLPKRCILCRKEIDNGIDPFSALPKGYVVRSGDINDDMK